jgi:hypothetical protein
MNLMMFNNYVKIQIKQFDNYIGTELNKYDNKKTKSNIDLEEIIIDKEPKCNIKITIEDIETEKNNKNNKNTSLTENDWDVL